MSTTEQNNPKIAGELTPAEVEELDNLTVARSGAESALTVALNFHANRCSILDRDTRDFWRRVGDRLDFDEQAGWKAKRINGTTKVVELTDKERENSTRIVTVHP